MTNRKSTRSLLIQRVVPSLALLATSIQIGTAQEALPEVGARIDETKVQSTLYVAQSTSADDTGAGQKTRPFKTISAAMKLALGNLEKGVATKVVIAPGTYREALPVIGGDNKNQTFRDTLLVIEGEAPRAGQTGVVISGADVVKNWQPVVGHPGVYRADWNENFGFHAGRFGGNDPHQILAHRREMVFINGQPLLPVILEKHDYKVENTWTYTGFAALESLQNDVFKNHLVIPGYAGPGAKANGSFGIVERDEGEHANSIFIRPAAGVDPNKANVEVAKRDNLLSIWTKHNVVLRNLQFQHAATRADAWGRNDSGAINIGKEPPFEGWLTRHVLLDNVHVKWSNNDGLRMTRASHITLRNSSFNYCGGNGIGTGYPTAHLWENTEFSHNNWRLHVMGGGYGWAAAGFKTWSSMNNVFRNCKAYYNGHGGFWTDGNNRFNRIEGGDYSHNGAFGIWIEISPGPTLINNVRLAHNGYRGLMSTHSAHVTLQNSEVFNNGLSPIGGQALDYFKLGQAQVYVGHSGGGREYEYFPEEFWTEEFKHGEGKKFVKVYLKNFRLLNNKIYITPDADKAVAANAVMVKLDGSREQLTEQGNTFTHPFRDGEAVAQ